MLSVIGLFLVSGMAVGSLYSLSAVGLVLLYRCTGILNFAYGAIAAASAMLSWQLLQWGIPAPLAWLSAIACGVGLSAIYGLVLAPALAWREPAVKAVATLGYMLVLLGLMGLIWNDTLRKLALPTDQMAVSVLGVRITLTRVIALASSFAVVAGMAAYLNRSRTGLNMRALADDRAQASLLGIPIVRTELLAWSISGALAGFTGLMLGSLVRLEASVITFFVIPVVAAAICGKLRSLPLTLAAGLLIGVAESLLTLWTTVASFKALAPFAIAGASIVWTQRSQRLTFPVNA